MRTRCWVLGILFTMRAMGGTQDEILVQLENTADAPRPEIRKALAEAGWILRRAGIEARWVECGSVAGDRLDIPACRPRGEPGLFVISILPEDPRETRLGDALGFAVLAGRRNGAAVIYPRIVSMLRDNPHYADCNILGSVIAHELGHLLLQSPQHGEGIMKANWGVLDFEAMKQRRLKFSQKQAREIRAGMQEGGARDKEEY